MTATRRLAAILAADVAGYSRLMGVDEAGTARALREHRAAADPLVAGHSGRIVKTTGDGVLIEFPSVVSAVECAVALQMLAALRNSAMPSDRRMEWRIGVHLGDVLVEGDDILGEGVNIAARLEGIAEPGGICLSEDAFRQVRGKIDAEFADIGEQSLKNIARPVRVYSLAPQHPAEPHPAALPLPDKPSIAVLPFQNMSGDPEQEYFVDGMVEEIITALSRIRWLFVIARNSTFTYKGRAVDVKEVGRELGVRYVLEGSVRKGGNRVRITAQLIDALTGTHLWADRFDGSLEDVFELQDKVAISVAGMIEPTLRQSEIERATRKPTENLDAYDLYLRALAEYDKPAFEGCDAAIGLLRQALGLDPSYAPAAALIAYIRRGQITAGVQLSHEEIADALRLARHAIAVGRDDPDALWMAGLSLAVLAGEHAAAMSALERATTLNPNCAQAWRESGVLNCFINRPAAAIAAAQRAMRLSPLDPLGHNFKWVLGYGLMLAGRYDEAMEWTDRSLHDRPGHHPAIRGKVALCGYLGRVEEGREWIRRLLEANPAMTIAGFKAYGATVMVPGTIAVWVEGFRRAGLPEE